MMKLKQVSMCTEVEMRDIAVKIPLPDYLPIPKEKYFISTLSVVVWWEKRQSAWTKRRIFPIA